MSIESDDPNQPNAPRSNEPNNEPVTQRPLLNLNLKGAGNPPPSQPVPPSSAVQPPRDLEQRVADLQRQEAALKRDIAALQNSYDRLAQDQSAEVQKSIARLIQEGLADLEQRRKSLQVAIEQLERRQERIKAEMRTSFAGVSQDLAVRVQGFKDYLVGSLQDLAAAAEQLELGAAQPSPVGQVPIVDAPASTQPETPTLGFRKEAFRDDTQFIRDLLNQYRSTPDYYGPPWQLRRTFEPVHADRVSNWFFEQGGRGAIRSMGSRLQNILIASAVISVLVEIYGERLYALVLANSPERLGEWRRGLQDCLGISRGDFGAEQGVVLFEAPEPLAQRADRLIQRGQLPLIIVDESEEFINLSLLQFPLWLAFAPDPTKPSLL